MAGRVPPHRRVPTFFSPPSTPSTPRNVRGNEKKQRNPKTERRTFMSKHVEALRVSFASLGDLYGEKCHGALNPEVRLLRFVPRETLKEWLEGECFT
jgi:hypothetical protein